MTLDWERERRLITIPYKKKQLIWYSGRINKNEIKVSNTFELLEKLEPMPSMVFIKCWTFFVKK